MNAIHIFAATIVSAGIAGAASAEIPTDTVLWTPGRLTIENGQPQTLTQTKADESHRVCLAPGHDNVALKVLDDGNDSILVPGECATFEGRSVRVAAAQPIPKDSSLVVAYERTRR